MPTTKIKDIAVVASHSAGNPIGEAPTKGKIYPPMTPEERVQMGGRLFNQISYFMEKAHATHQEHCKLPDSEQVDPDYITRLSTNEFFFYTQEPLTLEEFESLQDKIADKAATLPAGIQLVLGSFAVKNAKNQVMNITPHISCGPFPAFHFLIKNHTSPIDVRYNDPSAHGSGDSLPVFDIQTFAGAPMPAIKVKGKNQPCGFDNRIFCNTPGGEPFLTVVDICLDHLYATAKNNVDAFVQENPATGALPISHMVVSNSIALSPLNSYGIVMHVDTKYSRNTVCKAGVTQTINVMDSSKHCFGFGVYIVFTLDTAACQTLQEVHLLQDPKEIFDALKKLKLGPHDEEMDKFITEKEQAFQQASTTLLKLELITELSTTITALKQNKNIRYIQSIIASMRATAGLFTVDMQNKANRIENAMMEVPILERCQFDKSPAAQKVMVELAAHRTWGKRGHVYINAQGEIDLDRAAKSYKKYRALFKESSDKDEKTQNNIEQNDKKPDL